MAALGGVACLNACAGCVFFEVNSVFNLFRKLFGPTLHGSAPDFAASELRADGSEICRYRNGLIGSIRDARGRKWQFAYAGQKLMRFVDPSGLTWCEAGGRWHGFNASGQQLRSLPAGGIEINQETGEISLVQSMRRSVYNMDGEVCTQIEEEQNGCYAVTRIKEFNSRPRFAKVAVEKQAGGKELLRWIEDANGVLHCFEYEGDKLSACVDVSSEKVERWRAERDVSGELLRWLRDDAAGEAKSMTPHLESVDKSGNRHFRAADGSQFVVKPSGAAFKTMERGGAAAAS